MPNDWKSPFGHYLRTLRERRGLSLDRVSDLSNPCAEGIDKCCLSRAENGRHGLPATKLIPLSQVYGVPVEVFLERIELDIELANVQEQSKVESTLSDPLTVGRNAVYEGNHWQAYGYLRDAAWPGSGETAAVETPAGPTAARIWCARAASRLGRFAFALHECLDYLSSEGCGSPVNALIGASQCYVGLRDLSSAEVYAAEAAEEAREGAESGAALSQMACIASMNREEVLARETFARAFKEYQRADDRIGRARVLNNIGATYANDGHLAAARRAYTESKRLAEAAGAIRLCAMVEGNLGEADMADGFADRAVMRWKEAVRLSTIVDDRRVRFYIESLLHSHLSRLGNEAAARAAHRRLLRLSPWGERSVNLPLEPPQPAALRTGKRPGGAAGRSERVIRESPS